MIPVIKYIHKLLPIQFVVVVVFRLSIFPTFLEAKLNEPSKQNRSVKVYERGLLVENHFDQCQGDCDVDEDCKGDLICFQRDIYESVPGCRGGDKDSSYSDYCIDRKYIASENKNALPELKYLGRNPATNYHLLQECEGDCDQNSDCASGLGCLQRRHKNSGSVPGCNGRDDSLTDYCVKSSFLYPDEKPKSPLPPPKAPRQKSYVVVESLGLKMYWEPHYMWQEENFDRRWCMECLNGRCEYGDKTYIHTCERAISQRYDFISVNSNDTMIRVHGTNLCFERIFMDIFLYDCDPSNRGQLWVGDFRRERFEIKPSGLGSHCMTQRHHPKFYEEVEIEPCVMARSSHTSYWTRY